MIELGERFLKEELKHPGSYAKLIKEWKEHEARFQEICQKIDSSNLKELSINYLKNLYLKFTKLYMKVWEIPLTANNISYYTDNEGVPDIIKKYGKKGLKDFITLSTPVKMSFIKEEEEFLFKIAIKKNKGLDIRRELEEHAEKYHWIKNNYRDAEKLGVDYFFGEINKIKNPEKKLRELHEENKELKDNQNRVATKFTKEETALANLIVQATTLQDLRKKNNLMGDYYILEFLKEIAKRTEYSFEELCFTTIDEINKILSGKKISELKSRIKYCVELIELDYDETFQGEEAVELYNLLDNIDNVKSQILEVKGVVASLGKAKGVARVVQDVSKAKEFNKGDILVASMTRPDYTTLMKKAGGIVTDEGGITSHAAIVSRELGIPCIIGTKIATRVFKDGDMVEVDANKGIVRKIE
ncbi:MAG: hypothetical protein ISS25_02575 [Nanoarchaeota archaeon]|nr:hypothetical protein [DPANN group archaeon]MBL7116690.1 hypothetical protein [Nanoarchaeota archaeon]